MKYITTAVGEPFVMMDFVTQKQGLFAICSDMDMSDTIVIIVVQVVDRFGWMTFSAMERKRTLQIVDITAGVSMTVNTVKMFL